MLEKYGYEDQDLLLLGLEGNEEAFKFIGWGSQHNLTFEELVRKVTKDISNPEIIVERNGQEAQKVEYEIRFYPQFGHCYDLVNFATKGEALIQLSVQELEEAHVYITDKKLRTRNDIHKASHWGTKIILHQGWIHEFVVEIEQLSNKDPRNPDDCKEYYHDAYEKCVENELQKVWKPLINCNPPWLSSKDQCHSVMNITQETEKALWNQTVGTIEGILDMKTYPSKERCTKPCTVAKPTVMMNGKDVEKDQPDHFILNLNFADQVVYTTKKLTYGPSEFLVDIGSSLGLWFGLSVFGITDLSIMTFLWLNNARRNVLQKCMVKVNINCNYN
jgi:hypothetical protein